MKKLDYEIHYRSVNNEYLNSLNTEYGEWTILPIFLPPLVNSQQQRTQILGNQSETLQINDLECGAFYELFVKQPLNGWQSELIHLHTLGKSPIAPRKMDILQLVNRTLYVQLNSWFLQNPAILQLPTSLPLIVKRANLISDQSDEEFNQQQQFKDIKQQQQEKVINNLAGCPIHRFMCEYRTSNAGLWKLLNVQQANQNTLQPVELNLINEKVIYTIRITAYTIGRPITVAEYDIRLNEQGLIDYDEFLVLDNEDSITPMNINSKVMMLDQHTMFSIICSSLILLVLGFVLLILLIQRRRGLLLHGSNTHPDKNIYRKVINNGGDTTASASLLQSTIAYNRSVASSIRQPNSTAALLSSTAFSSSNAISNSADSNYVAQAAAVQAVAAALSGNCSPRLNSANFNNYNPCNKLVNNITKSLNANSSKQPPELPSIPPPPLTSTGTNKRSNAINLYKQSTLMANHRNLSSNGNNNNANREEEITPYATFTMSAEDVLEQEQENLMESSDQLPPHIQELHEMHRQLTKIKQQQQNDQKQQQQISASVIDLFKFGQSKPQQFIKQQIDKMGISRSRTAVDRTTSVENNNNSPSSNKPLRKSNNLIYGEDNSINNDSTFNLDRLEKKLLDEEQSDLRMFSVKIDDAGYMYRLCMDGNQMIGCNNSNQLDLELEQRQQHILTPPASYLNTINRNEQQANNFKLINQLNELNKFNKLNQTREQFQLNTPIKKLNQFDAVTRAETQMATDSTCSALYEFSCIFNKQQPNYDNKMQDKSALINSSASKLMMNRPSKNNKNLIRLISNSVNEFDEDEKDESLINNMINKKMMISDEQVVAVERLSDEEEEVIFNHLDSMLSSNNEMNIELSSDSSQASSTILDESNRIQFNKNEMKSSKDHLDNCGSRISSFNAATAYNNYSAAANETNKNDDGNSKFSFNFKQPNKQSNKNFKNLNASNLAKSNYQTNLDENLKAKFNSGNRKSSWTDMQTMLITDQKSSSKKEDKLTKSRLNEFAVVADENKKIKKQQHFKNCVNQSNFNFLS